MEYKKFGLYKLVREGTPKLFDSQNIQHDAKPVSRGRYLYKLKYKLIEQARDVLQTKNKKELIDKLGSVFEVFSLILKENNVSMSEVLEALQTKQQTMGSIQNLFISVISAPENMIDFCIKNGYKEIIEEPKI